MTRTITKRSVVVGRHRTSISLEAPFWDVLRQVSREQGRTVNDIISEIDKHRVTNLSSAIRCFVLSHVQGGGLPTPPPAQKTLDPLH